MFLNPTNLILFFSPKLLWVRQYKSTIWNSQQLPDEYLLQFGYRGTQILRDRTNNTSPEQYNQMSLVTTRVQWHIIRSIYQVYYLYIGRHTSNFACCCFQFTMHTYIYINI